jgi:hypothetical protein
MKNECLNLLLILLMPPSALGVRRTSALNRHRQLKADWSSIQFRAILWLCGQPRSSCNDKLRVRSTGRDASRASDRLLGSCLTTRNWVTASAEISTESLKSACFQAYRTELDWLVGMSHRRLSIPILIGWENRNATQIAGDVPQFVA